MTAKALLKQSEMRKLAALAKEYGIKVECEVEGKIFRFAPDDREAGGQPEFSWGSNPLAKWRGRFDRQARPTSGPHDPLLKWYQQIGFDPATMSDADYRRLVAKADQQWKDSIPSQPLNKLERAALAQLAAYGPDRPVHWREIKNCGPATEERLEARGFIKVIAHEEDPGRAGSLVLTTAGYETAEDLGLVEIRL